MNRKKPNRGIFRLLRNPAAVLGLFLFAWWSPPALAQVDFPIGYSSLGGTYAFISLIEEQKLLEKEGRTKRWPMKIWCYGEPDSSSMDKPSSRTDESSARSLDKN